MNKRERSIEWWKSLKPNEQQAMVMRHFPRMEFMLVSMPSSNIEQMFNKEKENEKKNN